MTLAAIGLWAKAYARTHILYLSLIAVGLFAGHSWLAEHDNRLLAEQNNKIVQEQLKESQARVEDLNKQVVTIQAQADSDKKVLFSAFAKVKTPEQAKPVIENLAPELHPTAIPNTSTVAVEAVPLAAALTQCRVDQVDLGSCKQQLVIKDKIIAEKDGQIHDQGEEIKTLKKPKGFWKRLYGGIKIFGVGVGVGTVLGVRL